MLLVTFLLVGICSAGALGLDVCRLQVLRRELQTLADSAALAAAAAIQQSVDPAADLAALALQAAQSVALDQRVDGRVIAFTQADILLGRCAPEPPQDGPLSFVPDPAALRPTAVRVTCRLPRVVLFNALISAGEAEITAASTAAVLGMDFVLVTDASLSMGERSRILHVAALHPDTPNTEQIWAALPNEPGDPGFDPGTAGPTFGYFQAKTGFGTSTINIHYDPSADPGLVYLPLGQSWDDKPRRELLEEQGYNALEIDVLVNPLPAGPLQMQGELSRIAVANGWVGWSSGLGPDASGRRPRWMGAGWVPGNGDGVIGQPDFDGDGVPDWVDGGPIAGTNELIVLVPCVYPHDPGHGYDTWKFFTLMNASPANNPLQHYYGVKSYMEYLLQHFNTLERMPELAAAPQLPMQWWKDALAAVLTEPGLAERGDRVAVEAYSDDGYHLIDLVSLKGGAQAQRSAVVSGLQPGMNDLGHTNMQAGIVEAHLTLTTRTPTHPLGEAPCTLRIKNMLIMSDGQPDRCLELEGYDADGQPIFGASTADCTGYTWTDPGSGELWTGAPAAALQAAEAAARDGIRFNVLSVEPLIEAPPDADFMEALARVGGGRHFSGGTSIEELTGALRQAYHSTLRGPALLFE